MAEELSGEHKLRIVLESILRNIPKEEQCKKYGISEDMFQEWHDHLITNGGKIFDPDFGKTRTARPESSPDEFPEQSPVDL